MTRITEADLDAYQRRNPDLVIEGYTPKPRPEPPLARAHRMANPLVPSEAAEQRAVIDWAQKLKGQYPSLAFLFHVPNGGERDPKEAALLKAEGVKAGVPDLLLPAPHGGWNGIAIELKKADRSNEPTYEQLVWLLAFESWGWKTAICYGAGEAIDVLQDYVGKEQQR